MPASNPETILTRQAAGAIVARRAVTFGNVHPDQAGARVMGVATMPAASGEHFGVVVSGSYVIEAGAAIADGAEIIADNQGRAVAATGAAGEFVFADALMPAGGAGQPIEVLLRR